MSAERYPRRAQVVGAGLIGGSVGLALVESGWHVTIDDLHPSRSAAAVERGAAHASGRDPAADLGIAAVPVGDVVAVVRELLATSASVVTDVAGVKAPLVAAIADPRFVGGHPMAGSEQEGIAGSRADMFVGAAWVLTPDATTDPDAYSLVHDVVKSLGAEVVTLPPERHDEIVALVSHVPHLAAATLMDLASTRANDQRAVMRLAAGGFRDMTRVAAGHPGIWPDICAENRDAIVTVLDSLIGELGALRQIVATGRRSELMVHLERASEARRNLPVGGRLPEDVVELRVVVPDKPGQIAAIAERAGDLDVNLYDIEIAHSAEGPAGVLIVVIDQDDAARFTSVLSDAGFAVSVSEI